MIQHAFLFPGPRRKTDFGIVSWTTFTNWEIGRVRLTEEKASKKYVDQIKIYKVDFNENNRAQTEGEATGLAKIVCQKNNKILGTHFIGLGAGEIIHEFAWTLKYRLKTTELNQIIRVYLTLSKITQAVATEATLENLQPPFVQKWFARYLKLWRLTRPENENLDAR